MTNKGDMMTEAPEPGSYARPDDPPPPDPMVPDAVPFLNGRRYPFFVDEVTSVHARKVREQTGVRLSFWMAEVTNTNGRELDSFAVLLWLARMQAGEPNLNLDDVVQQIAAMTDGTYRHRTCVDRWTDGGA